jgi:hypothetical protein
LKRFCLLLMKYLFGEWVKRGDKIRLLPSLARQMAGLYLFEQCRNILTLLR